jgi:hypothetical protein
MRREEYAAIRHQYEPERLRLVVIAESPPASGRYFYRADGLTSEPLFAALMQALSILPCTKEDGLREFQRRGFLLVDATYEPVNTLGLSSRNRVIVKDYPLLCRDLDHLMPNRSVPLVLVKANVCQLLEPKLTKNGFKVLNHGRVVYFPSTGGQKDFQRQLGAILRVAGISLV